jgi:UDP-N-acetylglucosamine diphosphorylase / glucose-1-phosphate thymidylyltransferase / UDP-N-acetylgalactosamine diphosphorylase / glucosamine-1-phosphate N-acetyltransferase / galactosamine-1-phosphate N-acetyltransferase
MTKISLIPTQAVILAAGENSRFIPFETRIYQKCNFSLTGKPIILQTVKSLYRLGIKEIIIIVSPHEEEIQKSLSNLRFKDLKIHYRVQKKPLGMANALLTAKDLLKERFIVLNPQQINIHEHLSLLKKTENISSDTIILFSRKTVEPQKYGILGLKGQRVISVTEKPKNLKGLSDQRILGIYILNLKFVGFMSKLGTAENQLESALNDYSKGNQVIAVKSNYSALSLKYAWDLFPIAEYLLSGFPKNPKVHKNAHVHRTALISGPVIIEEGAQIFEYSLIQGPCYIGKNSVVGSYCKVRKGSILEEGVEVQNNSDIKHSIIDANTHIHSGFVGDSIIGKNCGIGAGFITANRRLDRNYINIKIRDNFVDVGNSYFGALIGDNVKIGILCGTNPGVIIHSNKTILPMSMISTKHK